MVKIISREPHKSVVKEVICPWCGATLEYTPKDVREDYTSDYTGDRTYFKFIDAPCCETRVRVKS